MVLQACGCHGPSNSAGSLLGSSSPLPSPWIGDWNLSIQPGSPARARSYSEFLCPLLTPMRWGKHKRWPSGSHSHASPQGIYPAQGPAPCSWPRPPVLLASRRLSSSQPAGQSWPLKKQDLGHDTLLPLSYWPTSKLMEWFGDWHLLHEDFLDHASKVSPPIHSPVVPQALLCTLFLYLPSPLSL